jgi:GNAT superfamily N-acetyltransferase
MTLELTIRPARASDLERITEFTRDTWGPGSGDHVPDLFPRWLEEDSGIVLVAELAGRVIGVVHGEDQGNAEMWCEGMRVDPTVRSQGIASRLQAELNRRAQAMGFRVWRLASGYWNAPAHRAAAHNDFRVVHTVTGWKADPIQGDELQVLEGPPPLAPDALIGLDGWHYVSGRNFKPERIKPDQAFVGDPGAWALLRVRTREEWDGPRLVVGQVGGERDRHLELLAGLRAHASAKKCTSVRLWWPKGDNLPAHAGYEIIYDEEPGQPFDVLVFEGAPPADDAVTRPGSRAG